MAYACTHIAQALDAMIAEKTHEGIRHAFPMQVHSYHPRKEKENHFQPPSGFTVRHLPLTQADADEIARAAKLDCTEENGVAMKDIYSILLTETNQSKITTPDVDRMPTAVVKKVRAWQAK